MDLFDQASNGAQMPLAARMRPQSLEQMVGQQHLLSLSSLLRRAIEADSLPSVILQGPAGSGKTTLARIISNCTRHHFVALSGVSATVSDFREAGEQAHQRRKQRALSDEQRGLGKLTVELPENALQHLVENAGGDARVALNALEMATLVTSPDDRGTRRVTLAAVEDALQRPVLKYDRAGDEHYDTISAFIKSIRGSDPDAAIYWLAKMLEAGEDPRFIARRLIIAAAEDIGLADPTGLRVATAAANAVEYVGMPEAQIPLAMATIHLAVAPKSNSAYKAIAAARKDVCAEGGATVPGHLSGGARPGEDEQDTKYLYPHDYPHHWVEQNYLPGDLTDRHYYQPKDNPREQRIKEFLRTLRSSTTADQTTTKKDDKDGDA